MTTLCSRAYACCCICRAASTPRDVNPYPPETNLSVEFILETRGLTKEFKGFVAVNNVDLKVQRGHIHALIGPNGAGKTTFFNLLTKFLIPTRGSIVYNGSDITFEKPAQTARRGIVRSFQISAVFPHMQLSSARRLTSRAGSSSRRTGHLSWPCWPTRSAPGSPSSSAPSLCCACWPSARA